MKKILAFSALVIALASCNNSSESNATAGDSANKTGMDNQSAVDTSVHPNGVNSGDVISTDTAAMNVQKSIDKGKAAKKKE